MVPQELDIEKYVKEDKDGKKKKGYTLYLTEENVDYLKNNLKVSLSFIVDDFLKFITKKTKEVKKQQKKKESENEKEQA